MQIKDVTKRRDDEIVIHYIDDNGNYQSLRAYPSDIIAWHNAAQQSVQADSALPEGTKGEVVLTIVDGVIESARVIPPSR